MNRLKLFVKRMHDVILYGLLNSPYANIFYTGCPEASDSISIFYCSVAMIRKEEQLT